MSNINAKKIWKFIKNPKMAGVNVYQKIKFFLIRYSKICFSILIFILVFVILGLSCTNWGFFLDDFGVLLHSKIKNFADIVNFFVEGDPTLSFRPSNFVQTKQEAATVIYRPLIWFFHFFQYHIFGLNPYYHYLFFTLLHAINSVLVFYVFTYFTCEFFAFLAALFFAFHINLATWFGWCAALQALVAFLIVIFIIAGLKKYLDTRKKIYCFLSYLLFLISLLTRETVFLFPLWLIGFTYAYEKYSLKNTSTNIAILIKSIKINLGFLLISLLYFLLRLYLFPLNKINSGFDFVKEFSIHFNGKFLEFVSLAADLANVSFLPGGHRLFKGVILIIIFSGILYLFIKNTQKKFILLFSLGFVLLIWPSLYRHYSGWHLYQALPFFILIMIFLFKYYDKKNSNFYLNFINKRYGIYCVVFVTIFNACFVFFTLKNRELMLHKVNQAIDILCMNPKCQNRVLCFIGLPYELFCNGLAQAVWLHNVNVGLPIYCNNSLFGIGRYSVFDNSLMKINKIKDGFNVKTVSPERLSLAIFCQYDFSMGNFVIKAHIGDLVSEVDFIFDKKFIDQNMLFICWNYEKSEFVIIE